MIKRLVNFAIIALTTTLISACGGASSGENPTQIPDPVAIPDAMPEVPTKNDMSENSNEPEQVTTEPEDENEPQELLPSEPDLQPVPQPELQPQPSLNLPPANTLTLELKDPRVFSFSWRPMRGLTHYSLFEKVSNDSEFIILKDNISPINIELNFELPLLTRVNASYKLQACTADGCTDSNTVTVSSVDADLNSAIGHLTSTNNDNFDRFGRAVSISGDGLTIAVGSPFADVQPLNPAVIGDDTGTVTIYKKNIETLKWQESAYLVSPAGRSSYFGRSLQLDDDGSTLAVGANGVNSVYIYEKRADIWSPMARVQPPQPESGDNFGYSVAINDAGNRIIVGAHGEDSSASGEHNNDLENSGAAYIFIRSERGFSWNEIEHLKASNTGAGDHFGWAVDMNGSLGSTVVVGAPNEDSASYGQLPDSLKDSSNNDSANSGAAYIFRVTVTDRVRWEEQAYLKASVPRSGNLFGSSVTIADFQSIVAIGAPNSSQIAQEGQAKAGLVYTFSFANSLSNKWRFGNIVRPRYHEDGDRFGHSVSFNKDGSSLVVGAPGESGFAAGIIYYSEFSNEQGTGNENSGAAYSFKFGTFLGSPAWNQTAYIRQPGVSFGDDSFGYSIAIDNKADTFVVGQPGLQFDGAGRKKGSVFIY